jgi:hypothetical protein
MKDEITALEVEPHRLKKLDFELSGRFEKEGDRRCTRQ